MMDFRWSLFIMMDFRWSLFIMMDFRWSLFIMMDFRWSLFIMMDFRWSLFIMMDFRWSLFIMMDFRWSLFIMMDFRWSLFIMMDFRWSLFIMMDFRWSLFIMMDFRWSLFIMMDFRWSLFIMMDFRWSFLSCFDIFRIIFAYFRSLFEGIPFMPRPQGRNRCGCQVLLADVAWRGSLPESAVSLEALRGEVAMEELHDQLAQHGALVAWSLFLFLDTRAKQRHHWRTLGIQATKIHQDMLLPGTKKFSRNTYELRLGWIEFVMCVAHETSAG